MWEYRDNQKLAEIWTCVKSVLRIFSICYSPEINRLQIELLRGKIDAHLTSLKNLGLSFIAKHHILTHYPRIIEEMGPTVFTCMFAFERKHKLLKKLMNDNSNFTNIPYIIARKHQENLSEVKDSFRENIITGEGKHVSTALVNSHANNFLEDLIGNQVSKQEVKFLKYCNH